MGWSGAENGVLGKGTLQTSHVCQGGGEICLFEGQEFYQSLHKGALTMTKVRTENQTYLILQPTINLQQWNWNQT